MFGWLPTEAAQLEIVFAQHETGIGRQFRADVYLDTEGEEINAVEAKILYSRDILTLDDAGDGNSIISLWTQKPKIGDGEIYFSGIIPGGYKGEKGLLLSLNFRSIKEGTAIISFSEQRAFLNDGKGTKAKLKAENMEYRAENNGENRRFEPNISDILYSADTEPPKPFELKIAQNENMFDGKWFLVFNAQDKESGINRYEILEYKKWKIENKNWEITDSPYVLKDQKLESYIYVKAVDKSGNERISVVFPRNPPKWYENSFFLIIIILGTIIGYALIKKNKNGK